jgi:ABC-2 type transport system ATP-binding protein
MIEARGLVKRYGATAAVNDLSFTIRPGLVTGFLGLPRVRQLRHEIRILRLAVPERGEAAVHRFEVERLELLHCGDPFHPVQTRLLPDLTERTVRRA